MTGKIISITTQGFAGQSLEELGLKISLGQELTAALFTDPERPGQIFALVGIVNMQGRETAIQMDSSALLQVCEILFDLHKKMVAPA